MRAISWVMKFLGRQCIVMMVLTSAVGLFSGTTMAVSALLGGLLVVIPNTGLAIYLFSGKKTRSAQQMVKACYIGEALKIALIAVLLVLVLHYIDVTLAPLLIGFCGTYSVYFIGSWSKAEC